MPIMPAQIAETVEITENGSHNVARYTMANVSVEPVTETLNITPTTSAQVIEASGIDGYNTVNVSAVTAAIDSNIKAKNIKKDVTILGVTGSFEGGVTPTGTKSITTNGIYDVADYASANVTVPSTGPTYYVEKLNNNGVLSTSTAPLNLTGITKIGIYALAHAYTESNLQELDMSEVVQLYTMACYEICKYCTKLTKVNLRSLTSVAGDSLTYAFGHCTNLTDVNLSSLKTGTLDGTFTACYKLENIALPAYESGDLLNTFAESSRLKTVDLSAFETGNLYSTFYHCLQLEEVDLSSFTQGNLSGTFEDCMALKHMDLSNLTVTRDLTNTFKNCTSLETVNLSGLTDGPDVLQDTFNYCTSLKTVSLGEVKNINVSNGIDFIRAFCYCYSLEHVDLNFAEPRTLTCGEEAFHGCGYAKAEELGYGIPGFELKGIGYIGGQGRSYTYMLAECGYGSISFPDLEGMNSFNSTANYSEHAYLFGYSPYLYSVRFPKLYTLYGSYLLRLIFESCTSLYAMTFPALSDVSGAGRCFYQTFNNCTNLKHVYFPSFDNNSFGTLKTQFQSMLSGCTGVTVHFPMAIQSKIGSWANITSGFGGTNCVALFDLVYTITDSNGDTFIRCGRKDQYTEKEIFDENSELNGKLTLDIEMEAWVKSGEDPDVDGYYLTIAKGNTASSNGWSNSEPAIDDILYKAIVNDSQVTYEAYSTITAIA